MKLSGVEEVLAVPEQGGDNGQGACSRLRNHLS